MVFTPFFAIMCIVGVRLTVVGGILNNQEMNARNDHSFCENGDYYSYYNEKCLKAYDSVPFQSPIDQSYRDKALGFGIPFLIVGVVGSAACIYVIMNTVVKETKTILLDQSDWNVISDVIRENALFVRLHDCKKFEMCFKVGNKEELEAAAKRTGMIERVEFKNDRAVLYLNTFKDTL